MRRPGGHPTSVNTNVLLRGFSFRLGGDGQRSDILTQSAPVHFARTLDQMLAFLAARIPGPDGKPDRDKVEAFSAGNPETRYQANSIRVAWSSFPRENAPVRTSKHPVWAQATRPGDPSRRAGRLPRVSSLERRNVSWFPGDPDTVKNAVLDGAIPVEWLAEIRQRKAQGNGGVGDTDRTRR